MENCAFHEIKDCAIELLNHNITGDLDTEDRVILNVGGTHHDIRRSTLVRHPATRLARLVAGSEKSHFYFDRNPAVFNSVIDYYRNGIYLLFYIKIEMVKVITKYSNPV